MARRVAGRERLRKCVRRGKFSVAATVNLGLARGRFNAPVSCTSYTCSNKGECLKPKNGYYIDSNFFQKKSKKGLNQSFIIIRYSALKSPALEINKRT